MSKPVIRILFLLLALLAAQGTFSASGADEAANRKKELQRIKREMREKKQGLRRADRKERSILSELDRIDRAMQTGIADLSGQQKRLREAEAALRDIEKSNKNVGGDLDRLKRTYRQRVRALYKMGRSGFISAVLASDSIGAALKRAKYLGIVAQHDRALIREYGIVIETLAKRQAETEKRKGELLRSQRAVLAKKAELETRRKNKAALLSGVKREKGLYEQTLRELEEASAGLWAMIKKAEQERKAAQARKPAGRPEEASAGRGQNRFPWPLQGQVLTRFGIQRHPEFGTTVYRRGIEIEARTGDEVRAVETGQVAYADWYKGYGKLMILDHGHGLYTLYGHLSRLDLNEGAAVQKGQAIGLAGDTGSLKGAKLYFEIRRNSEAEDPLLWLAKR